MSKACQYDQWTGIYMRSGCLPANSVDVGFDRSGKIKVDDIRDVLEVHASGHTIFFIAASEEEIKKKKIQTLFHDLIYNFDRIIVTLQA